MAGALVGCEGRLGEVVSALMPVRRMSSRFHYRKSKIIWKKVTRHCH